MKTTFFAILASAAVVLASPLPEAEADAHQGQPASYNDPAPPPPAPASYGGGQGGQPQWSGQGGYPQGPGRGGQGQWAPPASYGNGQPAYYPNDPPAYPPQSGIQGSIIQGGQGGGWAPAPAPQLIPGPPGAWSSGGQWGQWYNQGVPPPPQFGYQAWPQPGGYPAGSPFNNGGVSSFGNTCSNSQQAVSCCDGGDSTGLLGGILPSTCTLDLLSNTCSQSVACCDTQEQNGLVNIGLQCSSLL